jgi:hypothetical protein
MPSNKKRVQKSKDPLQGKSRCKAKSKRTGKPCGNPPMNGQAVCRMHGGATKAARAKAQERILAAADLAAKHLIEFMTSKRVPYPTRLAATREILDRAGISEALRLEIQTSGRIDNLIERIIFDVNDAEPQKGLPRPRPPLPRAAATDSGASGPATADDFDDFDDWPDDDGPAHPRGTQTTIGAVHSGWGKPVHPDHSDRSSEYDDDDVIEGVVLNGDDAVPPHPPHPYNPWRRPAPGAPGW